MKPEQQSIRALSITRSKAKMYEYDVPPEEHIALYQDPAELFYLVIGIVGDLAAEINRTNGIESLNAETRASVAFSARFLDSYLQSRLNQSTDTYTKLLGAAAYYLSDNPGSAKVLASSLGILNVDLEGYGLETLLLWILNGNFDLALDSTESSQSLNMLEISNLYRSFFASGQSEENLIGAIDTLREQAYGLNSPRALLFADVVSAVIRIKIKNSVWKGLPAYSGLSPDLWRPAFAKSSFTKELWPAQRLLGAYGFFSGASGVVQMPTSAGKTKATEMILRSAFLSNRAKLTIVVAPFRALAHEIKNGLSDAFEGEEIGVEEVSDVLMSDFDFQEIIPTPQSVLVITPEKLMHSLRHVPELFNRIDLLILDEGHQFDAGSRGIGYELLITDLKRRLKPETQIVLISAVIGNAAAIGNWLCGEAGKIAKGTDLVPTFRTIAFPTWRTLLGQLDFRLPQNVSQSDFFVPRVLSRQTLSKRPREKKDRYFPDDDSNSVALYLGLKLISQGSVAIYCGTKAAVGAICEYFRDVNERNGQFTSPLTYSNQSEVGKLKALYDSNMGDSASSSYCANFGIFTHQGNTPHGIRIAVEYAMQKSLAKFVICTSTLAQGVNLPLRYLIVSSVRQGRDRMSTRDFNNLIGRAGRSGMHTEGSIIFADTRILDSGDRYRFDDAKDLLNPDNAEPCSSTLLTLFEPLFNSEKNLQIEISAIEVVRIALQGRDVAFNWVNKFLAENPDKGFLAADLRFIFDHRINLISAVESYLLANWTDGDSGEIRTNVSNLAIGTLAYYLAPDKQKSQIVEIFIAISENILERISTLEEKKVVSRVLLGVMEASQVRDWVTTNFENMTTCGSEEDLLEVTWPLITSRIRQKSFVDSSIPEQLLILGRSWILGSSYHEIFLNLKQSGARIRWGAERFRDYEVDNVVEICELGLAFDAALILGAISEFLNFLKGGEASALVDRINTLHKRLKYGLANMSQVIVFEMGFADRVVCQKVCEVAGAFEIPTRDGIRQSLISKRARLEPMLDDSFPSYYKYIWQRVLNEG